MPKFNVTLIHKDDRKPRTDDLIESMSRPPARRWPTNVEAATVGEAITKARQRFPEYEFEEVNEYK